MAESGAKSCPHSSHPCSTGLRSWHLLVAGVVGPSRNSATWVDGQANRLLRPGTWVICLAGIYRPGIPPSGYRDQVTGKTVHDILQRDTSGHCGCSCKGRHIAHFVRVFYIGDRIESDYRWKTSDGVAVPDTGGGRRRCLVVRELRSGLRKRHVRHFFLQ